MSLLDRIIQTDLAASTAELLSYVAGKTSYPKLSDVPPDPFSDPQSWLFFVTLEKYLRSIAIVEAGSQLGIRSVFGGDKLSFAQALLSNKEVSKYCEINQLSLVQEFLARLDATQLLSDTQDNLALPSDRTGNDGIVTIDYEKPLQMAVDAFHDVVGSVFSSLAEESFLRSARSPQRVSELTEILMDDEQFEDVLAISAKMDSEGEGSLGLSFAVWSSDRTSLISTAHAARDLLSFHRFQVLVADLDESMRSIEVHSGNYYAVRNLLAEHIFPDAHELAQSVTSISEVLAKSLRKALRLKRHRAISGQQQISAMRAGERTGFESRGIGIESLDDEFSEYYADEDSAAEPISLSIADAAPVLIKLSRDTQICVAALKKFGPIGRRLELGMRQKENVAASWIKHRVVWF